MMHPTEEQLNAWLDGERDAVVAGAGIAEHLAGCARCRLAVEGGRSLGAAMRLWAAEAAPAPTGDLAARVFDEQAFGDVVRLWATDTAPAPVGDLAARVFAEKNFGDAVRLWAEDSAPAPASGDNLADKIFADERALGDGLRLWAEDAAPAPSGDLAAWVFQAAARADAKPAAVPSPTEAKVLPLGARRRTSRWIYATVSVTLAAAAALVFAIARPHGVPSGDPDVARNLLDSGVLYVPGGPGHSNPPVGEDPQIATADSEGSTVLAVEGSDESTTSVMDIDGLREGTSIAVVWIEDPSGTEAEALQ